MFAPVAQRIEHLTTDQKVGGSNPSGRAKKLPSELRSSKHSRDLNARSECMNVSKNLSSRTLFRASLSVNVYTGVSDARPAVPRFYGLLIHKKEDNIMERLMTFREVTEVLSVSQATVSRLIRDGQLVKTGIGRSVRIRPSDLETFIEERTRKAVNFEEPF